MALVYNMALVYSAILVLAIGEVMQYCLLYAVNFGDGVGEGGTTQGHSTVHVHGHTQPSGMRGGGVIWSGNGVGRVVLSTFKKWGCCLFMRA